MEPPVEYKKPGIVWKLCMGYTMHQEAGTLQSKSN